jgi:undecaprenyl-diphosphatase
VLLMGAVGGGAVSAQLVKVLVARPRPPLADARLVETSYSFPSEHATLAVALYGTAAFLLMRAVRPDALRALAGSAAALLALAIGVSRVYLGVHYPSDVLAGWALGGAWVALATVVADVEAPEGLSLARGRQVVTATGTALLAALAVGYLAYAFPPLPPAPVAPTPPPEVVAPDAVAQTVLAHLPHYTEGLTGDREEPVNIVLVGTPSELENAFAQAGWTRSQRLTLGVLGKAIVAAVTGRPDPAGPVTPDFLANEPETLAYSQPVGGTFAERHHIRIWTTGLVTSVGENVWLATTSFDEGFELAGGFLPTHHISPDIDAERDYVGRSLGSAFVLAGSQLVQLVPPESGHNFAGDPFYTNGQAFVLYLA